MVTQALFRYPSSLNRAFACLSCARYERIAMHSNVARKKRARVSKSFIVESRIQSENHVTDVVA